MPHYDYGIQGIQTQGSTLNLENNEKGCWFLYDNRHGRIIRDSNNGNGPELF